MQDIARPPVRRTRNAKLTVDCPVCLGRGQVSVPSHDGTIERGYRSPAGNTEVLEDCGCDGGKVELLINLLVLEDAVYDALGPVIDHAVRHLHRDDREWIRDDISTIELSRNILAGMDITLAPKVTK